MDPLGEDRGTRTSAVKQMCALVLELDGYQRLKLMPTAS